MDKDGRKHGKYQDVCTLKFPDQRLGRQMLSHGISLKTFSHLYVHFSNPVNRTGHVKAVLWYQGVVQ